MEEEDGTYLEMDLDKELFEIKTEIIDTKKLGMVRIVEAPFDDPNGNPITFDTDYLGCLRKASPAAGPLENIRKAITG